jgi:hypothetical protein
MKRCQASVAHTCNPSYSGSRDQEDHGSKLARANSLRDPISKKSITKRAGGWFKVEALNSNPSTTHIHTHTHTKIHINSFGQGHGEVVTGIH